MALEGSSNFALDMQGLAKLRYNSRQAPQQGLKQVSQQFESMLLNMMLKSMREASPKGGLLDSSSLDTYNSMLDQQWSQTLSQRGIGLADMLVKQLGGHVAGNSSESIPNETIAASAAPRAVPRSLSVGAEQVATLNQQRLEAMRATEQGSDQPVIASGERWPLFSQRDETAGSENNASATEPTLALEDLPAHISAFLSKLGAAAHQVSQTTGISSRLILAQAALETGWGNSEIRSANGRASHNLFNIKATGGWQGEHARVATTEYEHGRAVGTRDDFRVYDSYGQAFADYARLLTDNPRYAGVVNADSPEEAARQLQRSGYATDPNYASKLIAIMSQIPDRVTEMLERMGDRLFSDHDEEALLASRSDSVSQGVQSSQKTPASNADPWSIDRQPTRIF